MAGSEVDDRGRKVKIEAQAARTVIAGDCCGFLKRRTDGIEACTESEWRLSCCSEQCSTAESDGILFGKFAEFRSLST